MSLQALGNSGLCGSQTRSSEAPGRRVFGSFEKHHGLEQSPEEQFSHARTSRKSSRGAFRTTRSWIKGTPEELSRSRQRSKIWRVCWRRRLARKLARLRLRLRGRAQVRAEGRTSALLALFAARRIPVSEQLRQRIGSCTDLGQLDRWVMRAATAASAAEALSEA